MIRMWRRWSCQPDWPASRRRTPVRSTRFQDLVDCRSLATCSATVNSVFMSHAVGQYNTIKCTVLRYSSSKSSTVNLKLDSTGASRGRSQSRSLEWKRYNWILMLGNFVTKVHRFKDICISWNIANLKHGLRVTQGHWKRHYSIDPDRISNFIFWRYLLPFLRYSVTYSCKFTITTPRDACRSIMRFIWELRGSSVYGVVARILIIRLVVWQPYDINSWNGRLLAPGCVWWRHVKLASTEGRPTTAKVGLYRFPSFPNRGTCTTIQNCFAAVKFFEFLQNLYIAEN